MSNILNIRGEDGTWTKVPCLRGEKGDTGERGPQGPAGVDGARGEKGESGALTYIQSTEASVTLEAGKFYDFGECSELYIECAEPIDTTILNEYCGCFDSGETPTDFSFSLDITWNNNLEIKANCHYEFSIIYISSSGFFGLMAETEMGA